MAMIDTGSGPLARFARIHRKATAGPKNLPPLPCTTGCAAPVVSRNPSQDVTASRRATRRQREPGLLVIGTSLLCISATGQPARPNIILITSDLGEMIRLADRIMVFREGVIVGELENLKEYDPMSAAIMGRILDGAEAGA